MAYERLWPMATQLFITNGSAQGGIITVADTYGFYVKQQVNLTSATLPDPYPLEIKRIDGTTTIHVGPPGDILLRADVSAYLLADGARITANEQKIPGIKPDEIRNMVFEREPIKADRVILIDKYGRPYDVVVDSSGTVRLAVDANVTVTGISVDLDALTPPTRIDPDNVLIVGSEDGTKTGFKRAVKIQPDSSLDVVDFVNAGTGIEGFITVGTVAIEAKIGASPLTNRRSLTATNLGTAIIYWGYTAAVTILTGTPIYKKQQATWSVGQNQKVYFISSIAGNNTRLTEGA